MFSTRSIITKHCTPLSAKEGVLRGILFHEIGIAHTLGREVILSTQQKADIPFDLRHLRYVHYLNNSEGLKGLAERLQKRLADLVR